jgi:hypothetical protein
MIVKFDRIGRTGTTPEAALTVTVPEAAVNGGPDAIAAFLYRHVGKYLVSRDYNVSVDLSAGRVFIAGGRFGGGVIEEAQR